MASSVLSSAATFSRVNRTPTQADMVAPLTGLMSSAAFPVTRNTNSNITSLASNGGKVHCMQRCVGVATSWKERVRDSLSYLPDLSDVSLAKEVDYLICSKWIPCFEFELEHGFVYHEHNKSQGYYDGRYWTMWKLPLFGCTDSSQVLKEVEECKKEYPNAFIRVKSSASASLPKSTDLN